MFMKHFNYVMEAGPGWSTQLLGHGRMAALLLGVTCRLEHSNSGKKSFDSILATESIFFDSIRQSDKFAACTLIFK